MKIYSYSHLLILFFFLFSCATKNKREDLVEINIEPNKAGKYEIIDFIQDVQFIPLQTNDLSLIKAIREIKADNNHWYISDLSHFPIKLFDKKGLFVSEVGKKGNGPGEFVDILDFFIEIGRASCRERV